MYKQFKTLISLTIFTISIVFFSQSCSSGQKTGEAVSEKLTVNGSAAGHEFEISFQPGASHNHPTFAVWLETMDEQYIETVFVTLSLATGRFGHGDLGNGRWSPDSGEAVRPAALPYWLHKRLPEGSDFVMPGKDSRVPDAVTGATPRAAFDLNTRSSRHFDGPFRLVMEINQTWDWNQYWNNSKYPENRGYKSSAQPALVYAVTIDPAQLGKVYFLNPVGHSHYAGENGELYTDLSTITTALDIAEKIQVKLIK